MPAPPSSKFRRKVVPLRSESSDKLDLLLLSSAICNGEDLGPFVRKAFASGKPETLLQQLRRFSRSKESEIQDVCRAHYEDFIQAVDDLRSLLSDVDDLKSSLARSNSTLQSVASPLLTSLDALIESQNVAHNTTLALGSTSICVRIMELCSRANSHLLNGNYYIALKCIQTLEHDYLHVCPSITLSRMLQKHIPSFRAFIKHKVTKDFGNWLVDIRVVGRNAGQIAIGQASAARQREEEFRAKQREAEHSNRFSFQDSLYTLLEEDDEDPTVAPFEEGSDRNGAPRFDLTPLYRAYHIHQTLGLQNQFKQNYSENRKLQLTSDFQVYSMTPFLESHQQFFAQIAGFFIVEDRVLRTGGGLISKFNVDGLWDIAVNKMCSVLEDQFSRMHTASHLLLIKDYVSLLAVTLRRYGCQVDPLLEVLCRHRDKYHELLLHDCRKLITDALAADKLEQVLMRKEYEYSMNVLSFHLHTSDIIPAFPYIAPFSSSIPDCCRIVRSFIEDSVNFLSYSGQIDIFDIVIQYLNRLLSDILDAALVKLINSSSHGVSQAMQIAANMTVLERACDFFFCHAANLSGIPARMAEKFRKQFPLENARDTAEQNLASLLRAKIDDFMLLTENINWMADDFPSSGNEYANEVLIYLETLVSTAQQILPMHVLKRVLHEVLLHISERMIGTFLSDSVKRFNATAVMGIDVDIKLLESFAESQSQLFQDSESSAEQLVSALLEARQLVNLLMSNHPENFLNPVIRERNYNAVDYRKVVLISEKFRDASDRLFGSFGTRVSRQNPRKKSLDTLIKRLKDAS